MTENFEIEALEYLLDEMPPERRAAFEALVASDRASQQALKACADALARFACDAAPAEPLSAGDQQAVLATILGATSGSRPTGGHGKRRVPAWSRFTWPIAAALLLGLNIYQLIRPPLDPARPNAVSADPYASRVDQETARPISAVGGDEDTLEGRISQGGRKQGTRLTSAADRSQEPIADADSAQLEHLRRDYARLQRTNDALQADYNSMLRVIADRTALEKSVGRLATMELVDAASYARGDRKGLMEVARGILAEPGVVVAEVSTNPTEDPGAGSGGVSIGNSTTSSGAVSPGDLAKATDANAPYAWSVFDDKEHRGYLNLYNLPATADGQSLQLWVKTVDSSTYQRVGEVPAQSGGGNGSISYSLPAATAPAEILITQEPRATVGVAPSGAVVLRGP